VVAAAEEAMATTEMLVVVEAAVGAA